MEIFSDCLPCWEEADFLPLLCGLTDSALPLIQLQMSEIRDIPRGHGDLLLASTNSSLCPAPFLPIMCCAQPIGSPSFSTPATSFNLSLPPSSPHTLDSWPWFPFSSHFPACSRHRHLLRLYNSEDINKEERLGIFFSTGWFPCHNHIPAFLPCSSHLLCVENCSRWRMSSKIKLMWQLK